MGPTTETGAAQSPEKVAHELHKGDVMASDTHFDSGADRTATQQEFDVVVVGASLAGCTTARLFAMQGLSVALLEMNRDAGAYKQLCTHFIQPSATPVLERLGLNALIEGVGAIRNSLDIWTRYGWTGDVPPSDADGRPLYGYNIRRSTLDPLLRDLAAGTPGVSFMAGTPVRGLVREGKSIRGVCIREDECQTVLRARLVVAADGRNSATAKLAGVQAKTAPNSRSGILQAYAGVKSRRGSTSLMWFDGPEVAYIFPNDEGVTVLACMPAKDRLPGFRDDPAGELKAMILRQPDAPDMSEAVPLGPAMLVKEFANQWRPAVFDGMALAGDAMMSLDYLWGTGCGFAFQEAEWLVDSTAPDLRAGRPADEGLRRYAKSIRSRMTGHRFLINDFSRRRGFNPIESLMFSAAAKDREMSRHLHKFAGRLIQPSEFLAPGALLKAAWVNISRSATAKH